MNTTVKDTFTVGEDILVYVPNEGWLNGRITEPVDGSGMYGIHGPAEGRQSHPRKVHNSSLLKSPGIPLCEGMNVEAYVTAGPYILDAGWYAGEIVETSVRAIKVNIVVSDGSAHVFIFPPTSVRPSPKRVVRAPRRAVVPTVAKDHKYVAEDMDFRIVALEAAKELLASSNITDIMRLTHFILTGEDHDQVS
ncbi:hypothetical protein [Glutamicibacter ardleyensis]|uniref:Uncharacterized protein n=1 Tax=Glutamicibacter ardleyensis TaxID=225894 RepID=A0ABQ2DH14_9MICC|nr:hypothetical protein [Glutamicibacter ardleyensis]GGJ55937.1 hypothetical protein GCM10007173_13490 [Glutamicibacter ardleyensis]